MKIGLFTDTYLPEINGVVTSIHTLRKLLEEHGHEVYVITTKREGLTHTLEDHVLRLAGIELKSLYGYIMTSPIHIGAYNQIKDINLDLIHAHTEFGVGIFARIVAKMQNIPLVSTYHTTYEDYTHYVNLINSNRIDKVAKKAVSSLSRLYGDSSIKVIAPSEKTKEMLVRYGVKSDIFVVPTGLDLSKFSNEAKDLATVNSIREKYHITADDLLVIFVGRLAKEKSIDFIIDGFSCLDPNQNKIKFLIVGDGPDADNLKEKVKNLKLEQVIYFAGRQDRNNIPNYYHAANCFVSASLTETQGMTFIEALASGLPVFARPDDVLNDLIEEDKNGYFFTSPSEFADKLIKYYLLNSQEKQLMQQKAIEYTKPYNGDIFYQRVMKVYQSAINDYCDLYLIDKIKTKDDYVVVYLESYSDQDDKIQVSLDDYLKYGLRKGRKLTTTEITELRNNEKMVIAYNKAIKKLVAKDRTRKEMYDFFGKMEDLNIKNINDLIDKLEHHGYIDDYRLCQTQIFAMKKLLQGENSILRVLKKRGIRVEIINELLDGTDQEEEFRNALKYAEKIKSSIKDKSVIAKKRVLQQKLYVRGFKSEIVERVMQNLSFLDDERNEMNILKKVAKKAKKRYEKTKKGYELRNALYRYLTNSGYNIEDVYVVIDEMENYDEEN